MGRTQVYLSADVIALLDGVAMRSGASRSELIRRAIRQTYGERSTDDRLRSLRASAGVWRDRRFDGAEYVNAVRGDLDTRLVRLGLE